MISRYLLLLSFVVGVVVGEKLTLVRESFDEDHQLEQDHTKLKTKDVTGVETGDREKIGYLGVDSNNGKGGRGGGGGPGMGWGRGGGWAQKMAPQPAAGGYTGAAEPPPRPVVGGYAAAAPEPAPAPVGGYAGAAAPEPPPKPVGGYAGAAPPEPAPAVGGYGSPAPSPKPVGEYGANDTEPSVDVGIPDTPAAGSSYGGAAPPPASSYGGVSPMGGGYGGGSRGGPAGAGGAPRGVGNFPAFGKTKVETLGQQKEEVLRYGSNSDIEFEHDALKKRDRTSHKREEITKET